jgi:hypothetical protein
MSWTWQAVHKNPTCQVRISYHSRTTRALSGITAKNGAYWVAKPISPIFASGEKMDSIYIVLLHNDKHGGALYRFR